MPYLANFALHDQHTTNNVTDKELIELAILQNQTCFNSNSIIKATLLFIYFEGKVSFLFIHVFYLCKHEKESIMLRPAHKTKHLTLNKLR